MAIFGGEVGAVADGGKGPGFKLWWYGGEYK